METKIKALVVSLFLTSMFFSFVLSTSDDGLLRLG